MRTGLFVTIFWVLDHFLVNGNRAKGIHSDNRPLLNCKQYTCVFQRLPAPFPFLSFFFKCSTTELNPHYEHTCFVDSMFILLCVWSKQVG